jgi:ATP-dependent helicase/nuclease subunit A
MAPGQLAPGQLADAAVRERVIHTLDRPLVVEAGAGTGKTTLLVSRLLYALEVEAVRMRQVVAISFTEKAAAELRLRLRQSLEERCAAVDVLEPRHAALQRALRELHEARLSTIHAFAASILRERPVEAQLDPQFRTLDELESLQLQRTFWRKWVDEELEGSEAERLLLPALQAGVRLSPDLEILGRALYENRDLQSLLHYPTIPVEIETWMRRFRDEMLSCVQHGADNCREAQDKGLQHLLDLRRRLAGLEDLQLSSWPAVFLGELKIYPTRGKREYWRGDSGDQNKAQRKKLQEALTKIQQHLANRVLQGSLQWLERWIAAYDAEKRRMGVVDFQDLLLQAQRLVHSDVAVVGL